MNSKTSRTNVTLDRQPEHLVGVPEPRVLDGAAAEHPAAGPADRKSVWVVDDDETTLMLAEEILTGEGFTVSTFNDSARALARIAVQRPDVIVLDVMMPDLDGFAFCSHLRKNPVTADIPVLMVTSLNDSASIALAYDAGATNFATKPINWVAEGHRLRYMLRADETARKLRVAEREARVGKEDWERTFNAISDVVTLLGADLRVNRANVATSRALKRPLEQIIGARCFELFAGSDAPCPQCPVIRAMETGKRAAAEKHYRTPDADCMVTGTPVTDGEGRLLHVVHIARDLTEQKALEQQYLHAQKMDAIGTLAGGVAHDFNNLLAAIICSADLLRSDPQVGGENRELADAILESANRGASLSRQLLTLSRKGARRSEKRLLRINDVVRDLLRMLGRLFPKNISIRSELSSTLCAIEGSENQLNQVLMNLATNAVHAMPNGGVLSIETRLVELDSEACRLLGEVQPGTFVQLLVSDTGHGMDKETMKRMFEPFFTTKKIGEGTGLGLPVAYGIVKDHGGHISCSSDVGIGTTFAVYLPCGSGVCEHRTALQSVPSVRGGDETILLVDDDVSVRSAMKAGLSKLGYTVIAAGDGEEALRRYSEGRRIGLVVMDLGMPGIDGWECLKRLRAIDPEVRVLLTTGYGGMDLAERARSEGAVDLLGKPFALNDLLCRVRTVLDRR
ncbi:MAG TPA: response regulator [Anaeromyxobacteraceae bacterium]|nr:response regulator [Anaeromyxobacteraceae bacterium]